MPHGLGHAVGLDVHDVQPAPADWILAADDVITIEPGLYFNPALLASARRNMTKSALINWDRVDSMIELGGVRIEDVVLVTQDGHRVLSAEIPK